MTNKFYAVSVKFDTTDDQEKALAEKWLVGHRNAMISDEIGCFTNVQVHSTTHLGEAGARTSGEAIVYQLRDEKAFERYEADWAEKMRNDPERPTCIKVVQRYLTPAEA